MNTVTVTFSSQDDAVRFFAAVSALQQPDTHAPADPDLAAAFPSETEVR